MTAMRFLVCWFCLFSALNAVAGLRWEKSKLDIKAEPGDASTTVQFKFTNAGKHSVVIEKLASSCSCTKVKADKRIIPAGERGVVSGLFEFKGREGKQRISIKVGTSDGKTHSLTAFVEIPRTYVLSTRRVTWASSEMNPKAQTVHLVNVADKPIEIERAESSDPAFKAELKTVMPGYQYDLVVTPSSVAQLSRAIISISCKSDDKPLEYKVYAFVEK